MHALIVILALSVAQQQWFGESQARDLSWTSSWGIGSFRIVYVRSRYVSTFP